MPSREQTNPENSDVVIDNSLQPNAMWHLDVMESLVCSWPKHRGSFPQVWKQSEICKWGRSTWEANPSLAECLHLAGYIHAWNIVCEESA